MGNKLKATGTGIKHFFGARRSVEDYKALGQTFQNATSRTKKAKVVAAIGLYTVVKGSPVGLARNIKESIHVGRFRYGQLKRHQHDAEAFLQQSGLSAQGVETVMRALDNVAAPGDVAFDLSPQDAQIVDQIYTDAMIQIGKCINF